VYKTTSVDYGPVYTELYMRSNLALCKEGLRLLIEG